MLIICLDATIDIWAKKELGRRQGFPLLHNFKLLEDYADIGENDTTPENRGGVFAEIRTRKSFFHSLGQPCWKATSVELERTGAQRINREVWGAASHKGVPHRRIPLTCLLKSYGPFVLRLTLIWTTLGLTFKKVEFENIKKLRFSSKNLPQTHNYNFVRIV